MNSSLNRRSRSACPTQPNLPDLLKFDPTNVLLFTENTNECFARLQIENLSTTKTLKYCVKCSSSKYYKVKEPSGVLNCGRNLIYFKMSGKRSEDRLKDRFQIEVVALPGGQRIMVDYKIAIKHQDVEMKTVLEEKTNKQNSSSNMSMATFQETTNRVSSSLTSRIKSSSLAKLKETGIIKKFTRQRQTIQLKKQFISSRTKAIQQKIDDLTDEVNYLQNKNLQISTETGKPSSNTGGAIVKWYLISFLGGLILGIIFKIVFFW